MGKQHGSHRNHTLVICKKADCGGASCSGCGHQCSGMIYGCDLCKFFLDNFCLDLPAEISHPSHPDHRLALSTPSSDEPSDFRCSSCSDQHSGFSFRCSSSPPCDFSLHVRCAIPSPIEHKFHPHRLSFFEKWQGRSMSCKFCAEPCESLVLYCLECGFTIHLLCGPLPSWIHFRYCHRGRLTLMPSLEADEGDTDDEDFYNYCDVCDEEVKYHSPAYVCKGCISVAHITCVIPQVLSSLERERAVELVSIRAKDGQDVQRAEEDKIETLQGIMNSFNDSEKKDLDKIRKKRVAEIVRALAFRKNMRSTSRQSPFLDEVFGEFLERLTDLDVQNTDPLALYEGSEEVVSVGEYKVTWKLAPVLEDLFANHGDVSARSSSESKKVKTYVFVILCWTIYSMLDTKVDKISEGLLFRWWSNLIFVNSSGFDITFAINRLKVVMRAHYSLQDKKNTTAKLDKEIADLNEEIEELQLKLKEKEVKLSAKNEIRGSRGIPTDENLKEAYASKALAWNW